MSDTYNIEINNPFDEDVEFEVKIENVPFIEPKAITDGKGKKKKNRKN